MDFLSNLEIRMSRYGVSLPETRVRVTTGIIGGGILLLLLIGMGHFGALLATGVIASLMTWELGRVFIRLTDKSEKISVLMGLTWLMLFANFLIPKSLFEGLIFGTFGLFSYYLAIADRHREELRSHFDEFVFSLFVLVYIVCFTGFLPLIRMGSGGAHWLIIFLLIVWSNDTGAYFAGKKWGRRLLYPLVSPKKTLEGAIGGLIAGFFVSLLYKLIFFRDFGFLGVLITSLIVGVSSQLGDFCESFLKRAYNLKDTSSILPGHGGILDRFDGVVFSAPLMYLCCKIFGG